MAAPIGTRARRRTRSRQRRRRSLSGDCESRRRRSISRGLRSTDNVGVTAYTVERCPGGNVHELRRDARRPRGTSRPTSNSGLTAGATYRYRVRATDDAAPNLSGVLELATRRPRGRRTRRRRRPSRPRRRDDVEGRRHDLVLGLGNRRGGRRSAAGIGALVDARPPALPVEELPHAHRPDVDRCRSGSFTAPDHEYPSYLELTLTATDSGRPVRDTKTSGWIRRPSTLTFQSSPTGLQLDGRQLELARPRSRER